MTKPAVIKVTRSKPTKAAQRTTTPPTNTLEQQRQQRYEDMVAWMEDQAPSRTPAPTVHSASTKGTYSGADLIAPSVRPGAEKFLAIPSRMGNNLVHHFSRTTDLNGKPITSKT